MLLQIKSKIIQLAKNAVFAAEAELGSKTGEQKKKLAIEYILKNLPVPTIAKSIISIFLSGFISNSVEAAVLYMKSLPLNKGE